jgi:hypothetical protein
MCVMRQTTNEPAEATVSTVRKLTPAAKLPLSSVMQRLSEAERLMLEKRLAEPVECVYHPTFRRATVPTV